MDASISQTWRHLLERGILNQALKAKDSPENILVCECFVAGIAHHGGAERLQELFSGQPLFVRREANNTFDTRAVALYTYHQQKLGYIPRTHNTQPAQLLDQQQPLVASVIHINNDAQLHRAVYIAIHKLVPRV